MIAKVNVYYEGWGEHWHWGTLATDSNPRTPILFEYTVEALSQKLELSPLHLPLSPNTYDSFPSFQERLPGIVADALPDGWGRLLMDRLFRKIDLNPVQVGVLERLSYIGNTAMGALSFKPEVELKNNDDINISLKKLASESQAILEGETSELLAELVVVGGSPQGARPKALIYRCKNTEKTSTTFFSESVPWLVKFPSRSEHQEVCAVEYVYSICARKCGIDIPETDYFDLGDNLTAFGVKRFDREGDIRIPIHSLAGYIQSDFRIPSCDYETYLRATGHITQGNITEVQKAFERSVFNIVFNNRDDHVKNLAFMLNKDRQWQLSPVFDLTFNEGPAGYHQMSVMGEAWLVTKQHLIKLGQIADLSKKEVIDIIEKQCEIANQFTEIAKSCFDDNIRLKTILYIQKKLNENVKAVMN